jgi:4-amino-4-deoxy-L-arabinose transferase-like glycosyltransferase/thioredoxin-like negative regulator of GroEL
MADKAKRKKRDKGERSDRKAAVEPRDPSFGLLSPGPVRMGELKYLVPVVLIGLALRVAYFVVNKNSNPLFYHPILDPAFHHQWAKSILEGNFWGDEVFFKAPLYPYLLALLYKLSGSSIAFAVFFQHLMGTAVLVLIYFLSRRFFSRAVSLAATLMAALYWPLIYFEGDLLAVTLVVFLDVLLLLTLVSAVKSKGSTLYWLSGILLGLSAVARPSILIFAPFIPLCFYWSAAPGAGLRAGRAWLERSAVVFAGAAIVISPVIVRNYVIGRDIVPIASQGGVNFYIGNNPEANGSRAYLPGASSDLYGTFRGAAELAEKEVGRGLKPSEVSNFYFRKGLHFISSSPGKAFSLLAKKFYLFWAGVERSNNKYIQFFWREYGLGRFPFIGFWLVGPLAILGGALLWPRRRETVFFYVFVVTYMAGVVVFFVNARFRLPVAPVLMIFAAYALLYLYHALRSKGTYFAKAFLMFVVFILFVNYDYVSFRGVRAMDEIVTRQELANAFLKMGRESDALEQYEVARKIQETYPSRAYDELADDINYNIGALYYSRGFYSRAIEALENIQGQDELSHQAKRLLADCYMQKGMVDKAVSAYLAILRKSPDDVQSRMGLAAAYRMSGRKDLLDLSEQILRALCQQPHSYNEKVYMELARTLEAKGDMEGAEQYYGAASADPDLQRDALLALAWLYKRTGKEKKLEEVMDYLLKQYPMDTPVKDAARAFGISISR